MHTNQFIRNESIVRQTDRHAYLNPSHKRVFVAVFKKQYKSAIMKIHSYFTKSILT